MILSNEFSNPAIEHESQRRHCPNFFLRLTGYSWQIRSGPLTTQLIDALEKHANRVANL